MSCRFLFIGGVQNQGKDCWSQCGKTPRCSFCGSGLCCRKSDWTWWNLSNSECKDGKGGQGNHACVGMYAYFQRYIQSMYIDIIY